MEDDLKGIFDVLCRKNEYVIFNKEKCELCNFTCIFEKYSRIRKDIFAILFSLEKNHDQPFVQNACKNFAFSEQKKFAKYFVKFLQLLQKNQQ